MHHATHPAVESYANPRRKLLARLLAAAIAALLIGMVSVLSSPSVNAKQKFMSLFAQAYPEAAGTPLDSCLLCHTNPSHPDEDNLNGYGRDWEDGDFGDKDFLAGALVRRDSDGDGVPNGQEIQQGSFPGSASSSTPTTTTTTIPGAVPNGQDLYAARCEACHGSGGGDLSGTALGRAVFISITLNGQGSMPAQSDLSNDEAGAIWDYVTGTTPATTTTTTTLPGTTPTTTAPLNGATVWANDCAICHGVDGGNVVPTSLTRSQLISTVTNGIGSMRGFPELGSTQIATVADYLLSKSGPTTTTTTLPGITPTTTAPLNGATVWANECAMCHGASGGNLHGHALSLSAITTATRNGIGSMPGYTGRLSSAEITNVARYVYGLGASTGATTTTSTVLLGTVPIGATLYMQSCSGCHGVHGEGGTGGPVAGTDMDRAAVVSLVRAGIGSMPGYGSLLSQEEIEAVSNHVLAMAGSGEIPPETTEALVATLQEQTPGTTAPVTTGAPDATVPGEERPQPALMAAAPPIEPLRKNVLGVSLAGILVLGALVLWGRSLRNLSRWAKVDE